MDHEKTMNAEEYLQAVAVKNPGFNKPDDEVIQIKARGLRALIRQAHDMGVKHGRQTEQHKRDFFGDFFGRRK